MHHHIRRDERVALAAFLRAGMSQADIARELGLHPSSVSRELQRNPRETGEYHAGHADRLAKSRRRYAKVKTRKIENNPALAGTIEAMLHPLVSPEVVAHEMGIVHETIYAWIARSRPELKDRLPYRGKKRRRYGTKREAKQGWTRHVRSIRERPREAEERIAPGHFEGDTVRGRCGALLTLTDRKSRFEVVRKIRNEGADAVHAVLKRKRKAIAAASFTFDRGSCFALWQMIERDTGALVVFADPHAPWQRPSNENTNGRLRRVFPKRTDFSTVSQREVDEVTSLMNHTPRKCLGWRSPCEVYGRCCDST